MSKTHVLVKARVDYADEFNCKFFGVFPKAEWEEIVNKTRNTFANIKLSELECYFGTNESLILDTFDNWFSSFEVRDIHSDEASTLQTFFEDRWIPVLDSPKFTWGTGDRFFTCLIENYNEDGTKI